jgi:hypothetical protein
LIVALRLRVSGPLGIGPVRFSRRLVLNHYATPLGRPVRIIEDTSTAVPRSVFVVLSIGWLNESSRMCACCVQLVLVEVLDVIMSFDWSGAPSFIESRARRGLVIEHIGRK